MVWHFGMCLSHVPQLRLSALYVSLLFSVLLLLLLLSIFLLSLLLLFLSLAAFLFCFVYKKSCTQPLPAPPLLFPWGAVGILRMYIKYIINKVRIRVRVCVCVRVRGVYRMTDAR